MKKYFTIISFLPSVLSLHALQRLFLLCLLFFSGLLLEAQSLCGSVIDSVSRQPLEGAAVYFTKLKLGAAADVKGNFRISPLPKGTYDVEVQMLGYITLVKQITINGDEKFDFAMKVSDAASNEVIITALGNVTSQQHAPVPVTVVTHEMFLQQASTNVVDAIAMLPGITAITTGPGVSKPEINGLGYNRVLTLMDGERQQDFQWGDEHGIMIDPYAVYSAEIIRGAASLQYGSDAVAGVVSFKSQPLAENGAIQGSVMSEYQTNNGLIGNTVNIGGNSNGFVWDVSGSFEEAHCYSDPKDGYVWGTAFNQGNARAVLGLNKKWGNTRLSASFLHRQIEIPDGNRDSATGQFEFDFPQNADWVNGHYVPGTGQVYPNRANFFSYYPDISSYQILNHDEVWWQTSINAGRGKIIADIGYSYSHRQEIDTGVIPEENMIVNDIPYSIKYQNEWDNPGLKFTTGFNGMYEFMHNGPEPQSPYIGDFEIPAYHLFDIGGYGILEWDYKNLTLSGGLRFDMRKMVGQPMYLANYAQPDQEIVPAGTPGAFTQFLPFNRVFTGLSGSIGASYQLSENSYIKLNLAKSYRAPAINELTSNEVNPGGDLYELGDRNLKPEAGYEADAAVGYKGRDINFEVDGFYNYINNFIFSDRVPDTTLLGKSVFQYRANTAMIAGISAYFNIHPSVAKWLEINNGFTYTYSLFPGQTDSTMHIPWTPAPRLTSKVRFKIPTGNTILRSAYIEIGLAHYWAQNDIYSAAYTELPSKAYTLYNAGIGTNFVNPKTNRVVCSLFINCTNLMNLGYVDHTSRPQYFWAYNGANDPYNFGTAPSIVKQQSQGIYNMGRNVGFKLIFPIGGRVAG